MIITLGFAGKFFICQGKYSLLKLLIMDIQSAQKKVDTTR